MIADYCSDDLKLPNGQALSTGIGMMIQLLKQIKDACGLNMFDNAIHKDHAAQD